MSARRKASKDRKRFREFSGCAISPSTPTWNRANVTGKGTGLLVERRTGRNWALLGRNAPLALILYQNRNMAPQAARIWALGSSR